LSTQLLVTQSKNDHQSATTPLDAILRVLGVVLLMGVAIDQVVQLVPRFETEQFLGVGYLFLFAGIVIASTRLIIGAPSRVRMWAPTAVLGALALVACEVTRVVAAPVDNQNMGDWGRASGTISLVLETTILAISAFAIARRSHRPRTRANPPTSKFFAPRDKSWSVNTCRHHR